MRVVMNNIISNNKYNNRAEVPKMLGHAENFMFMEPCIFMKIIQVTNEMQLFMLFIDSNTLHVSGVTLPSSGAQEMCMQLMVHRCTIRIYT